MRPASPGEMNRSGDSGAALGEDILRTLAALPAGRWEGALLLGVSGGPDSLALLLAAAQLRSAGRLRPSLHVATVDHALRPGSAAEAQEVAHLCERLGVPHRILLWHHTGRIEGNLSAAARAARYRLLADEARRIGAGLLATAHHHDDQIETHRLAVQRGASGAALAGMRVWRDLYPDLVLVRPLLAWRKHVLDVFVRDAGLRAADDPSNRDPRFARARLRLEGMDASDEALAERAMRAACDHRRSEDERIADLLAALGAEGRLAVSASGDILLVLPGNSIDPALLSRAVTAAAGATVPPPRLRVDALAAQIHAGAEGAATLGGCHVRWRSGRLHLQREYGRNGPPALSWSNAEASACFDGRFDVTGQPGSSDWASLVPFGRWGRGPLAHRTLPVAVGAEGEVLAAHPLLRFTTAPEPPPLALSCRVAWRLAADLVLPAGLTLTCGLQNAANRGEPVGKGVASTYIRRQVKAADVV